MRIEHPARTVGQVPELESASGRLPALGCERPEDVGLVQCLHHGYPPPLARWHYHEECELHLIVATSGTAFVGDWIDPSPAISCSAARACRTIVVDRITSRLSEPVAQSDLARDFGMTQSQFSRWFRRAAGNTYVDFVNRVRINHACQLLAGSDRLIASVCQEVGFNNVANFNRRFPELEGITPSEFRRRIQARAAGGKVGRRASEDRSFPRLPAAARQRAKCPHFTLICPRVMQNGHIAPAMAQGTLRHAASPLSMQANAIVYL